jgi:hypothetical protein
MSMMMSTTALEVSRVTLGSLHPCPFCGGPAALERSPWLSESVRITCGNESCGVRPRTEYLLACYADELCAAWNARPATPARTAS